MIEVAVVVLGALVAVLAGCLVWLHVRLMAERRSLLNAALSRSPNEFRMMEREPPARRAPPSLGDALEEAARISEGMGDGPYRMPEGLNG